MLFTSGMIIFDDMTNLDFAGPADTFARVRGARTIVLSKTSAPVRTDSGGRVLADMTFADAPDLDLLFIGGGPGTLALMDDAETQTHALSEKRRAPAMLAASRFSAG